MHPFTITCLPALILAFIAGLIAGGRAVLYWLRPTPRPTFTRKEIDETLDRYNARVRREHGVKP